MNRAPQIMQAAKTVRADWERELRRGAIENPMRKFPSPPKRVLLERLRHAQARYRFSIETVQLLQPVQAAPRVVIRTSNPTALARATPEILRLIDPKRRTGADRTGWEYEGFLLEARDHAGVPLFITFNFWRGHSAGGGQWAARNDLYPFPHG